MSLTNRLWRSRPSSSPLLAPKVAKLNARQRLASLTPGRPRYPGRPHFRRLSVRLHAKKPRSLSNRRIQLDRRGTGWRRRACAGRDNFGANQIPVQNAFSLLDIEDIAGARACVHWSAGAQRCSGRAVPAPSRALQREEIRHRKNYRGRVESDRRRYGRDYPRPAASVECDTRPRDVAAVHELFESGPDLERSAVGGPSTSLRSKF